MRATVDSLNLRTFMRELARLSRAEGRAYLTGGASAVLLGWRETTMAVVRVARRFLERGHRKDRADVDNMIRGGLVEREKLRELFDRIEPELLRYPAIDPADFRRAVETTIAPS